MLKLGQIHRKTGRQEGRKQRTPPKLPALPVFLFKFSEEINMIGALEPPDQAQSQRRPLRPRPREHDAARARAEAWNDERRERDRSRALGLGLDLLPREERDVDHRPGDPGAGEASEEEYAAA